MRLVSLLERTLGLGHEGIVWLMTTAALVLPLLLLPLIDRLSRRR